MNFFSIFLFLLRSKKQEEGGAEGSNNAVGSSGEGGRKQCREHNSKRKLKCVR